MPSFVLDIENLYILLQIRFEPSPVPPYGRVITVTGYIRLLYLGTIVVEILIPAYEAALHEAHQDIPEE
jgi:hypothetical protein